MTDPWDMEISFYETLSREVRYVPEGEPILRDDHGYMVFWGWHWKVYDRRQERILRHSLGPFNTESEAREDFANSNDRQDS